MKTIVFNSIVLLLSICFVGPIALVALDWFMAVFMNQAYVDVITTVFGILYYILVVSCFIYSINHDYWDINK